MGRGSFLVRMINNIVRFLFPWVIRGTGWVFRQYILSLASVFTGFPIATRRLADAWVDRAAALDFPTRYIPQLYRWMIIAAWVDLIVAWIISSFITIWLVRLVWRVVVIFLGALWLALISML